MVFPIADGHCDYLYGAVQSGFVIDRKKREQSVNLADMLKGGVALQFFACWIDTTLRTSALHQCLAMIEAYDRMIQTHDTLVPLTPDFEPGKGKIAAVLTVEGGEAIDGSLAVLRILKKLGVRAMTLTWNETNELCGAAVARNPKGLTALGRDVVDEMDRIGVAIDVSHLSDKGIDDILNRVNRPIFASHSNARAVFASPRSLCDAHIREIARNGGVVGVNFYHKQLTAKNTATVNDIVRHICHVVQIGGIDCCALGSDYDGMQTYPLGLETSAGLPLLTEALLREGFSSSEVEKIAYLNLHRYISRFI